MAAAGCGRCSRPHAWSARTDISSVRASVARSTVAWSAHGSGRVRAVFAPARLVGENWDET